MSIVSLVGAERDRYVAYFKTSAAEERSQNPESVSELLISLNNEAIPYPYRYLRVDLLARTAGGRHRAVELWLDPPAYAEARGFRVGDVSVEFYPFTWCATQIAFDRPVRDKAGFDALFTELLDISDSRRTSDDAHSTAIHSVTQIETNGDLWYFTVDFGTAPADALLDVIDFVLNQGVGRIVLQSHSAGPA